MSTAMEQQPEYTKSVKAVIMLNDGERSGICLAGYDDDTEAMADMFVHLKAIFESNGKKLMLLPLGRG